jgi:hypothetical protein
VYIKQVCKFAQNFWRKRNETFSNLSFPAKLFIPFDEWVAASTTRTLSFSLSANKIIPHFYFQTGLKIHGSKNTVLLAM